ncbi:MAG: glutamine synthetase family protein [Gaiellales bacterium]
MSAERELRAFLGEHDVRTVIAAGVDTNGILRGKRLPVERFLDSLGHGVLLCDVFWVMDVAEAELVERPAGHRGYFPTKAQGYPDIVLRPDPATIRPVPWHDRTAIVLGTFAGADGRELPIDPRATLGRVVDRARSLGLEPMLGFELEFYLLAETPHSLAERGFVEPKPLNARPYTYGVYGGSRNEPVLGRMRDLLTRHGIPLEAANPETGPGQFEVNIRYGPALAAADQAALFKNGVKEIAAQEGLLATFMAKPSQAWAGSSCHVHVSLWNGEQNVFWDEANGSSPSTRMGQFMGGVLETMPELTAFVAPTTNAYKRFHPYSWAGSTATWGVDNRSTGLRAVLEGPRGTRVEHRQGGADANPYLVAAVALAGGLYGIEQELEPPPETAADAYLLGPDEAPLLPRSLEQAVALLEESSRARALLGEDLVDYYAVYRRAEVSAAQAAVTDWELRRYLEML